MFAATSRAPILGGNFAVWGGTFSTFDCTLQYIRRTDDHWNNIASGFLTGGVLAARAGWKQAGKSAVMGGVILTVIEGVAALLTRSTVKTPRDQALEMLEMERQQKEAEAAGAPPPGGSARIILIKRGGRIFRSRGWERDAANGQRRGAELFVMMQMLILAGLAYLLVTKWPLVKGYLPASVSGRLDGVLGGLSGGAAMDPRTLVPKLHQFVVLCTMLYVLLLPIELVTGFGWGLYAWLYLAAMWISMASSLVTMYLREGWEKCKMYIAQVIPSIEFHWLFYTLVFFNGPQYVLALIIPARRSFWNILKTQGAVILSHPQFAAYKPQYELLMSQEKQVLLYFTLVEIALGFYLIAGLVVFEEKPFLSVVLFWQFLRMRYQAPRNRAMQDQAWGLVGEKVDPVVGKVPPLAKGLDWCKTKFKQA
eukprot:g17971.t1